MKSGIAGIISILLSLSFVSISHAEPSSIPKDYIIMGEKMLSNENKIKDRDIVGPDQTAPPEKFCTDACVVILWQQIINDHLTLSREK